MSAAYRVCNSNHAAKVLQRQNLLSVFVTFCHFPSLFGVICHFSSLFVTFLLQPAMLQSLTATTAQKRGCPHSLGSLLSYDPATM